MSPGLKLFPIDQGFEPSFLQGHLGFVALRQPAVQETPGPLGGAGEFGPVAPRPHLRKAQVHPRHILDDPQIQAILQLLQVVPCPRLSQAHCRTKEVGQEQQNQETADPHHSCSSPGSAGGGGLQTPVAKRLCHHCMRSSWADLSTSSMRYFSIYWITRS